MLCASALAVGRSGVSSNRAVTAKDAGGEAGLRDGERPMSSSASAARILRSRYTVGSWPATGKLGAPCISYPLHLSNPPAGEPTSTPTTALPRPHGRTHRNAASSCCRWYASPCSPARQLAGAAPGARTTTAAAAFGALEAPAPRRHPSPSIPWAEQSWNASWMDGRLPRLGGLMSSYYK